MQKQKKLLRINIKFKIFDIAKNVKNGNFKMQFNKRKTFNVFLLSQ